MHTNNVNNTNKKGKKRKFTIQNQNQNCENVKKKREGTYICISEHVNIPGGAAGYNHLKKILEFLN